MDEQVNIPALGRVCFDIRISYGVSVVWLHVPQGKDAIARWRRFTSEKCPEMYQDARLYQIVPQTDSGGQVEKTKAHERNMVKELGKIAAVTSG